MVVIKWFEANTTEKGIFAGQIRTKLMRWVVSFDVLVQLYFIIRIYPYTPSRINEGFRAVDSQYSFPMTHFLGILQEHVGGYDRVSGGPVGREDERGQTLARINLVA